MDWKCHDFEVIVSDQVLVKLSLQLIKEIFDIKKGATIDLIVFWEEDITIEIRDSGPTGKIIDIIIVDSRNALHLEFVQHFKK